MDGFLMKDIKLFNISKFIAGGLYQIKKFHHDSDGTVVDMREYNGILIDIDEVELTFIAVRIDGNQRTHRSVDAEKLAINYKYSDRYNIIPIDQLSKDELNNGS